MTLPILKAHLMSLPNADEKLRVVKKFVDHLISKFGFEKLRDLHSSYRFLEGSGQVCLHASDSLHWVGQASVLAI